MTEQRSWDRAFVIGLVIGVAVMAYGIAGMLGATSTDQAREIATWAVAANVIHDAILAPVAAAVGFVAARLVRGRSWPAMRAGLIASACTVAVAYPLLRGFGRDTVPDNPSVAPLDHGTAVLGVVWLLVTGYLVGLRIWARASTRSDPRP